MSFSTLGELNWLAVIVATIVYFALGALWYSQAGFAKPWMRSIGWNPAADAPAPSASYYLLPFFGYLVLVIGIGMLAVATGSDSFGEGLALGVVLGILIAGPIFFTTAKFEPTKPEPMTWFFVSGGYAAAGILISSIILAVW
jgi:hypothetical protein